MDKSLIESIKHISIDGGATFDRWLENHPKEETPFILDIHEALVKIFPNTADIKKRIPERNSALNLAKSILKELGKNNKLKHDTKEIGKSIKRYLLWLGCVQVYELVFGGSEERPSSISHQCEIDYQRAETLREMLHHRFHSIFYNSKDRPSKEAYLEALIVALAFDGVLNIQELTMSVREIFQSRIFVIDSNLRYIAGPIANGDYHYRRVWLSDLTFCLALGLSKHHMNTNDLFELPKILTSFEKGLSKRSLFRAVTAYYQFQGEFPQIVISYMRGEVVSNSLSESCLSRIFGKKSFPEDINLTNTKRTTKTVSTNIEGKSVISELKKSLSTNNKEITLKYINDNQKSQKHNIQLLMDFVAWCINTKKLRNSYTLMLLSNLSQHLLPNIKDLDTAIETPDNWQELIDVMVAELPPTHKIFDAISVMSGYLTARYNDAFTGAGRSQKSSVNARIVAPDEVDQALLILKKNLNHEKFKIAESLVQLAYSLGARRWELLGLEAQDMEGTLDPILHIRDNAIRKTKTVSSSRCNSLLLCRDKPFLNWVSERRDKAIALGKKTPLFQTDTFNIRDDQKTLISEINKALQLVTRDKSVSFHSLRHSAVCNSLLSLYWRSLEAYPLTEYLYFKHIDEHAEKIRAVLIQPHLRDFFEHEAVSQMVGHLSFMTTADSYFHFFDLIRYCLILKQNNRFHENNAISILASAEGSTRDTRKIRHMNNKTTSDLLALLIENHKDKLFTYKNIEPNSNTIYTPKEYLLYDKLLEEFTPILTAIHNSSLTSRADSENNLINHENLIKKINIIDKQCKSKVDKNFNFLNLYLRETNRSIIACRQILTSRANTILDDITDEDKIMFSKKLFQLTSYHAIQHKGYFRFKTVEQATSATTLLSKFLGNDPINFIYRHEKSVRVDKKVFKKLSDINCIDEFRNIGKGALLVKIPTDQPALSWFRFSALIWVCCMIYLKFGATETSSGEALV